MNGFEDQITKSIMKRDGCGKFAKGNQEGEKFLQGEGGRLPGVKNKKTIAANQFAKDALHINPETGEKMTYKELVYYISKKAYESARILQLLLEYYLGKPTENVEQTQTVFVIPGSPVEKPNNDTIVVKWDQEKLPEGEG